MTKQEWKDQYSSARMLLNARFASDPTLSIKSTNVTDIVWRITYNHVLEKMHKSVSYAAFHGDSCFYDIKKSPIMMKHNSKTFNRKMVIRESKMKWRSK